nr:hypothetical protein BaRGS_011975 [Batillaria attramentaria]
MVWILSFIIVSLFLHFTLDVICQSLGENFIFKNDAYITENVSTKDLLHENDQQEDDGDVLGDTYYLIPTWRKRSQPHHYNNGKFPTSEEYLPTPVVTDLESDGLNEVVLVTVDGRLSVLVLPERPKMDDGSLPHVVVKNDVELQLTRSDGRIARPIIVIVTDDWHVMCYDPDLTLKWEVTLPSGDLGDEVYQVKSLGALITSHSVQKNDGGLIIIGGNFMHKTHHTKELPVETVDQEGNKTQETKTVVEEVENLTHFSTFALSVTNGTIRWHHMPGDFGEQKHNIQDQESEHHWKLGLRKNRKHAGESPWKMYSRQLNQHMGHTACYLDIWRVAPVKEKLEQLSLCISQRLIWQRSWAMEEDVFNRVPPVLIKSVAKKSGVFRHLLGQHLTSEQEYDLISFGAVGRMSSFDLTGNIHWQEIEEEFMQSFWPNFILLPLKVSDRKDVAAVVGWNSLSLVDLVDGTLLAEHSIPSPPTGPLAYGDFDNDGISDIILACKKGFIGFTVKQKANYEYTILYASAVLLIILFVTWVLIQPSEVPETPNK